MREALSEELKAGVLRSFAARMAETSDTRPSNASWRWNEGVYLFPEGFCPYCHSSIRSNRIWRVVGRQLMGRWRVGQQGTVQSERLAGDYSTHPHVAGTSICAGGFGADGASALWLGLRPVGSYKSDRAWWLAWLRGVWDHDCPNSSGYTADTCPHCCVDHCAGAHCRVVWRNDVRGCLCGCRCHPQLNNPCTCGHEQCRCPQPRRVQCATESCEAEVWEPRSKTCTRCPDQRFCVDCYDRDHLAHDDGCLSCGALDVPMTECSSCPRRCRTCHGDDPPVAEESGGDDDSFVCGCGNTVVFGDETSFCGVCEESFCDSCYEANHEHDRETYDGGGDE